MTSLCKPHATVGKHLIFFFLQEICFDLTADLEVPCYHSQRLGYCVQVGPESPGQADCPLCPSWLNADLYLDYLLLSLLQYRGVYLWGAAEIIYFFPWNGPSHLIFFETEHAEGGFQFSSSLLALYQLCWSLQVSGCSGARSTFSDVKPVSEVRKT